MIRITVEMCPGGGGPVQFLGRMYIANDGSGTKTLGNYNVSLGSRTGRHPRVGRVERFPRRRRGPWYLVLEGLYVVLGGKTDASV